MARRLLIDESMKTSLAARIFAALATVGLLGAPVLADTHHATSEKKLIPDVGRPKAKKAFNLGESYDLAPRRAALPEGDVPLLNARPRALTDAQIGRVMKKQLADVEYCWNRLPAPARQTDTTAVLKLSVEINGIVSDVEVESSVPASAQKCIAAAAGRWTFPVAETNSQVEYAVGLRAM
jgi:hypothetical protein